MEGQVERMNRTLKEATVNRYQHRSHAPRKEHIQAFLMVSTFSNHLMSLGHLPAYRICLQHR